MSKCSLDKQDAYITGKFQKVRFICIMLAVPGLKRGMVIPVFSISQMLGVARILENVGKDLPLARKLSRFIFRKFMDFRALEHNRNPGDKLYAEWLQEFKSVEGLVTGQFIGLA